MGSRIYGSRLDSVVSQKKDRNRNNTSKRPEGQATPFQRRRTLLMPSLVKSESKGNFLGKVAYLGPHTGYSVKIFQTGNIKPLVTKKQPTEEKALVLLDQLLTEYTNTHTVMEPCAFGLPITQWEENIKGLSDLDIGLFFRALGSLSSWALWNNHVRPAPLILKALLQNEVTRRSKQDPLFTKP